MTPISKLLRVFAVCAGVAAYVSLEKYDSEQKTPPKWPDARAQETGTADNNFDNPLSAIFSRMFVSKSCLFLPDDSFPYDTSKWMQDCSKGIRRTDSGDFLVRHLLQNECEKRNGVSHEPKQRPDPEAFPFVG